MEMQPTGDKTLNKKYSVYLAIRCHSIQPPSHEIIDSIVLYEYFV